MIRNKYNIRSNRRTNPIHTVRRVVEEYGQGILSSQGIQSLGGGSGNTASGDTTGDITIVGTGLIQVTESPELYFTIELLPINLDDLDDVQLSTLADGDVLVYVTTTGGGYWTNVALSISYDWDVKADGVTVGTINSGEQVEFKGGLGIDTAYAADGSNHDITISLNAGLDDLQDVDLNTLVEGQVLGYVDATGGGFFTNVDLPTYSYSWFLYADTAGYTQPSEIIDGTAVVFEGTDGINTNAEEATNQYTVQFSIDKTSQYASKEMFFTPFNAGVAISVGNGVVGLTVSSALNGWNLVDVIASCQAYGSSGTTDIQVRRERDTAGISRTTADMLSTKVTISASQYWASDGVVNASYDDVQEGDIIYIDVDARSSGSTGLAVTLVFQKP